MNWFVETATDGVVGGALGGVGTGAVALTLLAERRSARHLELRGRMAQLHGDAVRAFVEAPRRADCIAWLTWCRSITVAIGLPIPLAAGDKSRLQADLRSFGAYLQVLSHQVPREGEAPPELEEELRSTCGQLIVLVSNWVADPRSYDTKYTPPKAWKDALDAALRDRVPASDLAPR